MSIRNWFRHTLKNENCFSHLVMVIVTILGILIALELDKSRERADQLTKLNQYRIRLDNELKVNKQLLITKKQSLLRDYVLIEMQEDFDQQDIEEVTLAKKKLDSLFNLDSTFKSMVTIEELPDNLFSVTWRFSIESGTMTLDTWEALKGSDILHELTPTELILYTDIYHKISSFNDYYNSLNSQTDLMTKGKLREVILNIDGFEEIIGQVLGKLDEARNKTIEVSEIPEPQDTSKLSQKVREIKNKN